MNPGTKTCPFCGTEHLAMRLPQHLAEECNVVDETATADARTAGNR